MRFEKPTTNAYRELPYRSLWWVFPEGDDARRVQTSVPNASEPTWLGSRHIDPCFVFMCVCAQRTGTSLRLYGSSAADCTATGAASPVRPRLALGAWASNPFWPMGRRALRAKRGASAKETAEACRSGGPRTGTEPSARGALDEPSTRNTIRQPPRGGQIGTGRQATDAVIGGGMMARHTNRSSMMARRLAGAQLWSPQWQGRKPTTDAYR